MDNNMENERKYIDPTTDYGFKRIFGTEASEELLISLLNELFRGQKNIKSLTYGNPESLGDTDELGTVVFDLVCTGDNGEKFIVEMQTTSQANLKNRMRYYAARGVVGQGKMGQMKRWKYDVKEVYLILLMDGFTMPGPDYGPDCINEVCLFHKKSKKPFDEGFGYIYVELDKFAKNEKELEDNLDRWLYVLKNMSKMDKIPTYLRKTIFEKVFQIAEYAKLNEGEREMYNTSLLRKINLEEALETAREDGIREEREKAKREKKADQLRFAINFKKSGIPLEDISKNLGLSLEEVRGL